VPLRQMLLANLLEFVGSVVIVHVIPDPCEEGLEVWKEKEMGRGGREGKESQFESRPKEMVHNHQHVIAKTRSKASKYLPDQGEREKTRPKQGRVGRQFSDSFRQSRVHAPCDFAALSSQPDKASIRERFTQGWTPK
jgi:hypothetical protein